MDANRFFTHAYDMRHNPKVDLLRDMEGGIAAYGRLNALFEILYDVGGIYDISAKAKRRYLCKELELSGEDDLRGFLQSCAECELLSAELLEMGHVVSPGVSEQIEYYRTKVEAGKKSGEARRRKSNGTGKRTESRTS